MKKTLSTFSLLAMLSACQTYDPYTGEQETAKATTGAAIGGSVAAVLAYLDNKDEDARKRNQRVMAAAAGGAAIGGGIGYYMDNQEAKLRKQLRGTGVSVQRQGDQINLIMPGNITFASARAEIAADFYPVLNSVALVLEEYNKTVVVISGHTDSDGSADYNQGLSEQRANAVSSYLKTRKINAVRLETIGFGESQPMASNNTQEGKALNRRVEITLIPATKD